MPDIRKIKQGEIFWLDNCPPLDGNCAKRRPVIALGHIDPKDRTSEVLAVAVSHTASTPEKDPDMIRLPDTQQSPTVRTGLNRPSWAIPRWFVKIEPRRFGTPCGHIKGDLLKRVVAAVIMRTGQ